MRILISGAGGFVGRHLAGALARRGHDVVALMRQVRPSALDQQPGVSIACADLLVTERLPAGSFDVLIHCAAAIPSSVPDDAELTRINVEGSRRLFAHALHAGVGTIVFCSSMAVYGRITEAVVGPATPIREPNAYGRSKLVCEGLLDALCAAPGHLRAASIRLPGVVGPGSHHNFLSDTMARLAGGEAVSARNPDALFNNVVHVDDLAVFIATLLQSLPEGHGVLTIGAEEPLPIRVVVGMLEAAAGRAGAARYEGSGSSFLIASEAARSLGYRPATVRDSVQRFARTFVTELAAKRAGAAERA